MKRILLILVFFAAGCPMQGVQPVKVEGRAMLPALKDGDRIFVDRQFEKLERGDIVVFYAPFDQSKSYIKRIVGLPGETIEVREGKVFVNRTMLDEPYVEAQYNQSLRSLASIELTPNHYFVVGDNRDNSSDSRIWGPLKKELIYGRYTRKYFSAD